MTLRHPTIPKFLS